MSDPDLDRLAAFVRERRLSLRGMTQAEGAAKAGVSDTTWNQVEIGRRVSDRSLAKMAVALDLPPGHLRAVLAGVNVDVSEAQPAAADDIDMASDLAQLDDEDQEYVRRLIARLAREKRERGQR